MTSPSDIVERLRTRLESNFCFNNHGERISVPDGSIPDGIECRDETIKLLDKEIERLRLQLENAALASVQHEQEWRKAERERDALQKNADRYWWHARLARQELDAAIDAAREGK